ncbi:DUF262 domain-containing protein [Mycobacteroides abscessus subsp. abscessus]|uniref:DUF262 domain-containing protein n=1 Tax=Mycobacteroides abscessus TaxID=36809 RepID=UPI0009A7E7CE|nr:DUF262 domain-containing HNH endonuclease family protein [Mycobacteroides abscessus]MBN7441386.1 DUF262 domain-containing protein [Mycobacteroides abscessus subsp. abscessus]SLH66993.1 Uncharacterized conserved protein [Mycobacteroides abscessus subsp. abscessus]
MELETREIFDAAPLAISQFLNEPGQGLYIPPYQRQYSWEKSKVKRLLDDIGHGLEQLKEIPESICFLGSVIALRDINYVTVDPLVRPQVPRGVMTIIDGQQRLTSLLVLLTVLHEEIRLKVSGLKGDDAAVIWCRNQAADVSAKLTSTFQEDMNYGDGALRYYPRMIRAYIDSWSRNKGEAAYTSAIAQYLFDYASHARDDSTQRSDFKFDFDSGGDEDADNAKKHLRSIRDEIRRTLRRETRRSSGGEDEEESLILLSAEDIKTSNLIQDALFNSKLAPEVLEALVANQAVAQIARLVVFANYVLQRVTVAVVTAKREDYGFDMFEALNTTGEPLTALETFKPRVIRELGLEEWRHSKSKGDFDRIERYLDAQANSRSDQRQTATSALLISFALLHSGKKLSKRLSEQRAFLRYTFEKEAAPVNQENYVSALMQLTSFLSGPWEHPESLKEKNDDLEDEAAFALAVLKDGKHDIVVPVLARYYAAYRLAESATHDERYREFLLACRSCVAFYGLWRGALRGTAGIDNVYRDLMAGEANGSVKWALGTNGDLKSPPPVAKLAEYLWSEISKKGLADQAKWAKQTGQNPIGASHKVLTRLLLFAASEDAVLDSEVNGLTVRGKTGLLKMLSLKRWSHESLRTIEHTAPVSAPGSGWLEELFEDPELVNTIGNLTLLPARENTSAGNKSWALKRLFYRALSASTLDDAEALIAEAAGQGIELHMGAQEIVKGAPYLPLASAVAARDLDWTAQFVQQRGERLAELAWTSLAPWLQLRPTK